MPGSIRVRLRFATLPDDGVITCRAAKRRRVGRPERQKAREPESRRVRRPEGQTVGGIGNYLCNLCYQWPKIRRLGFSENTSLATDFTDGHRYRTREGLPNRVNSFKSASNVSSDRIPARRHSAGLPMGVKRPNFSGLTEIMHRKPRTTAEEHSPRPRRAGQCPPLRITGLLSLRLSGPPALRPPVVGPVADRAPGQRPGLQHSTAAKAMADTSAILPSGFRITGPLAFRPSALHSGTFPAQ